MLNILVLVAFLVALVVAIDAYRRAFTRKTYVTAFLVDHLLTRFKLGDGCRRNWAGHRRVNTQLDRYKCLGIALAADSVVFYATASSGGFSMLLFGIPVIIVLALSLALSCDIYLWPTKYARHDNAGQNLYIKTEDFRNFKYILDEIPSTEVVV